MICAYCGTRTRLAPCLSCSRVPLLAGRWRLVDVVGVDDDLVSYQAENAQGPGPAVLVQQVPLRRRGAAAVLADVDEALAPLRAAAHPAVPRVRGVVHAPCRDFDAVWIVRDLLVGAPLADLLDPPWSLEEVVSLVDRLLEAQAELSARPAPVRSGSLRPDTVILQPEGGVGFIAFAGLQAALEDPGAPGRGQRHAAGPWAAPEGGPPTDAGELFSVGAIAFTLLCGALPPRARGRFAWEPLLALPAPIGAFLDRLTEPSPARRPAGPAAARAALDAARAAVAALPPPMREARLREPPVRPPPRRPFPPLDESTTASHRVPPETLEPPPVPDVAPPASPGPVGAPAPSPAVSPPESASPSPPTAPSAAPRARALSAADGVDPGQPTGSRRAPVAPGPWIANPVAVAFGLCLLLVALWQVFGAWRG